MPGSVHGAEEEVKVNKIQPVGTSLVVQWLRLCTFNAGAQVPSLVGELRSHMPHCTVKK